MLGIPTRSDVKDSKYQRSVLAERMRDNLSRWPTIDLVYNHIIDVAYYVKIKFSLNERVLLNLYKTENNPARLALKIIGVSEEKINPYLNPESILNEYLSRIKEYRENLNIAEKEDLAQTTVIIKTNAHPNKNYYYDGEDNKNKVEEKKREFEKNLVSCEPYKVHFNQKDEDGFKVSFDPVKLARFELDAYEKALKETSVYSVPYLQLFAMGEIIKTFDDSANKDLFDREIINSFNPEWPQGLEAKVGEEAYMLHEEYKNIAKRSDIYLRFDESYIEVKKTKNTGSSISSEILFKNEDPLTFYSLGLRQSLRDNIDFLIKRNAKFVFNGATYTPLGYPNIKSYSSLDSIIEHNLVNILGVPIHSPKTLFPEAWAQKEVELVKKYRAGEKVAKIFIERYKKDNNYFPKSEEEMKSILDFKLKRAD